AAAAAAPSGGHDARVPQPVDDGAPRQSQLTELQKSKLRRKMGAQLRRSRLRVHAVHLLLLAAHMLRQDCAANDSLCRAVALSLLPHDAFLSADRLKQRLARFALWMRSTFHAAVLVSHPAQVRAQSVFRRACSASERIVHSARVGRGDIIDIASLACALVRAQNFRCRLVLALQPVPFRIKQGNKEQKLSARRNVVCARANDVTESALYAWTEVWSQEHAAWIVVDVFSGQVHQGYSRDIIDIGLLRIPVFDSQFMQSTDCAEGTTNPKRRSSRRQSTRRKKQTRDEPIRNVGEQYYSHVVAVENGRLTDVSRRYVRNWLQAEDYRAKGKLFENVLGNLSVSVGTGSDEALKKEVEEFESLTAEETVPSTMTAIQKHPRYVLERHIKRYELIWPREPIAGHIKNEPVFLRANVRLLHTKDRWMRQMREVKQNEKPMKSVKSKNGTDAQVQLYGEWQTQALKIAACKDGKVPRSMHGNVDLWTAEHLPPGAEHVNVPHAKAAAKKIGVDFAPAMTGFDIRGGRSIPRIEGVVVAAENAALVRDGAREMQRAARERAERRASEEAVAKWAKLVRALVVRHKVKKKYGGVGGASYESEQKRRGREKAAREKSGMRGAAGDGQRSVSMRTRGAARKAKLMSTEHEHTFDDGVHVEGDRWLKKCKVCELEVWYERL
ncbi:unnamed protein product, partial [Agarophyton chilense]